MDFCCPCPVPDWQWCNPKQVFVSSSAWFEWQAYHVPAETCVQICSMCCNLKPYKKATDATSQNRPTAQSCFIDKAAIQLAEHPAQALNAIGDRRSLAQASGYVCGAKTIQTSLHFRGELKPGLQMSKGFGSDIASYLHTYMQQ